MIYQISSGQGPAECELAAAKFLAYLQANYEISVLDTSAGYFEGTYRSVCLYTEDDLSEYLGSVQWICRSPYRPEHRRKNWFLDFHQCAAAQDQRFHPEQVVFETFRSGGKGGQNVNKVETGVRAIYPPTGQGVVCTQERSQYTNKQRALAQLRELVQEDSLREKAAAKNQNWRSHTKLERRNAAVRFSGPEFCKG